MMTPVGSARRDRDDPAKAIAAIARRLPAEDQAGLLRFAQFLAQQAAERAPKPVPEPEAIAGPEEESVIKAMRRLTATYPMIDRGRLLNETSALMAQHVMQGRSAVEVIDDLEAVFRTHYEQMLAEDPTRSEAMGDHSEENLR